MNKIFIVFSLVLVSLLSSCGFLLSPVGEELIVDAADEAVKTEHALVHPSAPVSTPAPITTKEDDVKTSGK